MMAWVYLIAAGALEVGWALGLKHSEGFTRPLATALTLFSIAGSLGLLALALKTLPLGPAYATWTGIGIVGTALAGIVLDGEPVNAARLACIALIIAGIAGLKLTVPA